MRRTKRPIAVLLAFGTAFALTPLASAQQQEPKLEMSDLPVLNGGSITAMTGPCATFSTVTSPGLGKPITLSAVDGGLNRLRGSGPTTTRAGTYTATVRCDGKTLTAQFTVLPFEIAWHVYTPEVEPGGRFVAGHGPSSGCLTAEGYTTPMGPLNSPGFAAPLKFDRSPHLAQYYGETTVITTPGVYEVVARCPNRPERSVKTFRILGTPPPPGNPKPKPPIVKPKGAPDTGGGGTA